MCVYMRMLCVHAYAGARRERKISAPARLDLDVDVGEARLVVKVVVEPPARVGRHGEDPRVFFAQFSQPRGCVYEGLSKQNQTHFALTPSFQ